jgi:hypothetical protein
MANAWDNDASSELDVRSGKPTKKVRWDVDGIDLRGETGEANRHGEGHRHGDTDSTYREPTSRAFTVTTTTTTTTTATLPVGNQSVNSINSDDDWRISSGLMVRWTRRTYSACLAAGSCFARRWHEWRGYECTVFWVESTV